MKPSVVLLLLAFLFALASFSTTFAQDLRWPKEISKLDDEMDSVPVTSLPLKVQHDIMGDDQPASYTNVLRIDLNGDGVKELVVDDGSGGSGGPGYHIYQRLNGSWKAIADFQGGITLAKKANGYFQLVIRSRGGGGYTGRELLRFNDGRYQAIYGETYKDGVFLRSWGAKELNHSR